MIFREFGGNQNCFIPFFMHVLNINIFLLTFTVIILKDFLVNKLKYSSFGVWSCAIWLPRSFMSCFVLSILKYVSVAVSLLDTLLLLGNVFIKILRGLFRQYADLLKEKSHIS